MSKNIILISFLFFVFTISIKAQQKGLYFSINYDSLTVKSSERIKQTKFGWLNSYVGFTLGGYYDKKLNNRFLLSSKAFYQARGFKRAFDNNAGLFHYVGVDETLQYRWNPVSKFHLLLGAGVAYRIPIAFKGFKGMEGLNTFDAYTNIGCKYEIGKMALLVTYSPSFSKFLTRDIGSETFTFKHRVIQLGIQIPLK